MPVGWDGDGHRGEWWAEKAWQFKSYRLLEFWMRSDPRLAVGDFQARMTAPDTKGLSETRGTQGSRSFGLEKDSYF